MIRLSIAFHLLIIPLLSFTQSWTAYTVSNSAIPANSVYDISVDTANNVWIATANGLAKFDSVNWMVWNSGNSPIPMNSNDYIYAVFVDDSQNVWLGLDNGHLLCFDGDTGWTDHSLSGFGDVNTIRQDLSGNIWVGHYYGLKRFDGNAWMDFTTYLPDDYVLSIACDPDSNMWFGTRNGLCKMDTGGNWTIYTPANSGLIDDRIEAIKAGPDSVLWIGTPDGLHRLDKQGWWTVFNASNSPLWDDKINGIDIDADSIVWIANDAASIAHNTFGIWTNVFFPSNIAFARAICIDYQGTKWVATQEGLVKYVNGGAGPIFTSLEEMPAKPVPLVFPNPSNGIFSIDMKGVPYISLRIYNMMGMLLHTQEMGSEESIDAFPHSLGPGSYLFQFIQKDGVVYTARHLVLP